MVPKVNDRVRVVSGDVEIRGEIRPHPHAGKTGTVTELLGVRLTGPGWTPRATVLLDDGSGYAIVGLQYLETI